MKFYAFLRDSYREAVSGWVLQIMLALTVILVLLVASVSFRPITLKDDLDTHLLLLNFALSRQPDSGVRDSKYAIENLAASDPSEPWKSDYSFDFVVKAPTAADLTKVRRLGLPVDQEQVEDFTAQTLKFLRKVRVAEKPLPSAGEGLLAVGGAVLAPTRPGDPPGEVRYVVTSKGTKAEDMLAWRHVPRVLFAFELPVPMSLREGVYTLEKRLVNDAGMWIMLLVSVVITAGFIPHMLQKGAFDLYIVKPISRPALLVCKYLGGLLYITLLTSALVGGVWVAIGLRTGLWSANFLALIPLMVFYFAVLYAVSTLAAVLTRSTMAAIVATVFAWGVFFLAGFLHDQVQEFKRNRDEAQQQIEKAIPDRSGAAARPAGPGPIPEPAGFATWDYATWISHGVLPRTYDLDDRAIRFIAEGVLTAEERKQKKLDHDLVPWPETIGVSFAFIVLCLGLASLRLQTRDG
ncbi:ABC transporter permease [Fimbriiglobus ruber]|uniref:ABC-type transport system involved in multi-copper enzyme maturation, permease component n=1 Tax=Fimbriiglobus ruber TaxID=1908690 RepID=A0A225E2H8_9BACT|nr:ABC transporter permease subunit [Fimbriiglobus ruber]OWK44988.1 hypothetical protein FRUB_01319 [Fimbriiglobus ruber]